MNKWFSGFGTFLVVLVVALVGAGFASLHTDVQEAAVPEGKIPIKFQCPAGDEGREEVCRQFRLALERNEYVDLEWSGKGPCFQLVVLPTVRGEYRSFTVSTAFLHPPLQGLWLSSFLGNFLFPPEAGSPEDYDAVVKATMMDTMRWLVLHREILMNLDLDYKPVLEVLSEG